MKHFLTYAGESGTTLNSLGIVMQILAHRIRISEILPLSYPGRQVTSSCEIAT